MLYSSMHIEQGDFRVMRGGEFARCEGEGAEECCGRGKAKKAGSVGDGRGFGTTGDQCPSSGTGKLGVGVR